MRSSRWVRWLIAPVLLGLLSGAVAGGVIEVAQAIYPPHQGLDIAAFYIFLLAWGVGSILGGALHTFGYTRVYQVDTKEDLMSMGCGWMDIYLFATSALTLWILPQINPSLPLIVYALLGGLFSSIGRLALRFGIPQLLHPK